MVDRDSNGWVTNSELTDTLSLFGMYVPKDDIYLFVKRYDTNQDGRLRFSEFGDAFVPKSAVYASALNSRKANYLPLGYPRTEYFSRDTRDLYLRTLKLHFSLEASAEFVRKRLFRRPGFNASDAFAACDFDKNGYITRDEFKTLLREYGFYATETEVQYLLERYDRNQDGKISYSEFIDEILPKSPSRI